MATAVQPAVVVGGGRVGRALLAMGPQKGDLLVSRGQKVPDDAPGPILVCTRNDDLDAVLDNTPKSRWRDLVFFQNGMLDPWFESKGLVDANQVLAYFAISKLGEPPVDGITDTNPEGLTAAFGSWAPAVAARLQNGGLTCKVLEKEAFQKQMLEKLIWISAFMLVGARHPGATVGVVEKDYRSEVASLIAELSSAAAAEKGLSFDEGLEERLCAYSRAVAHFPTAVKESSSSGGMVGFILSQRRRLQQESQIHVPSIQLGSRRLRSYRKLFGYIHGTVYVCTCKCPFEFHASVLYLCNLQGTYIEVGHVREKLVLNRWEV